MKYVLPALTAALLLSGAATTPALSADHAAKDGMTTEDTANETAKDAHKQDMTKKDTMAAAEAATVNVPSDAVTVSTYYNEDVYDPKNNKIGDVNDLLLDTQGRIQAVIVGVGGFLGVGEKDVAVPFEALKVAEKDGDTYLVMNATKEALEKAPGYVYDDGKRQWMPAKKQG